MSTAEMRMAIAGSNTTVGHLHLKSTALPLLVRSHVQHSSRLAKYASAT